MNAANRLDAAVPELSPVDVETVIDRSHLRGANLAVVVLLALVLAADGFDLLVMGFLAPTIAKDFGLSVVGIGQFLTISHAAIAVGGLFGGMAGDRWGRRPTLLVAVALIAVGTLLCSVAQSFDVLAVVRCAACFGIGAASPNVAAYLVETLSTRWRSQLTTLSYTAMSIGSTICGISAKWLLPIGGWRSVFEVGGVIPLLLLPLMWFLLPESPRFMASNGRSPARIARALNRLLGEHRFSGAETFVVRKPELQKAGIRALFGSVYLRDTLALALLTCTVMFTGIAITSMGPVLMTQAGVALPQAINALLSFNIAGLLGAAAAAFMMGRYGSRLTLLLLVISGGLGLLGLAAALSGTVASIWQLATMALCGFGLSGGLMAIYPVAAQVYPGSVRSTGVGAAFAMGRVGSTLSSVSVAAALASYSPSAVLIMLAVITLLPMVAIVLLRRHIRPLQ